MIQDLNGDVQSPPPHPQSNLHAQASYPVFMNSSNIDELDVPKGNISGLGGVTATTYDSRQPIILRNSTTSANL